MSQTTVNLGFVPKNRGDWEKNHTSNPDTIYYKDNIIQYRGSAFIYDPDDWDPENPLAVNTTLPPYTDSEGSATEPINGWKVFASDSAYCEQFFSVEENPEYCYVMLDTEQKIVWGIKQDGEPYFGVGCPQQIKDYVEERISSLSLDEYDDIVTFLQDYLGSDTTLKMMMDSLMTATDNQDYYNINKRNVEDTTILVWVANTNWQQIERENADAYDAGDTYRANEVCNIPEDEEHSYKSLAKQKGNYPAKQIEKIIRVDHLTLEEALALVPADTLAKFKAGQVIVFLNTEGNVVKYELQPDGTWKNIFEEINTLLDTKADKLNPELSGKISLDKEINENEEVSEASIQHVDNHEFIDVKVDKDDKILEGIKSDGTKVIGGNLNVGSSANINGDAKILGNMEVSGVSYKVIENPEYLAAWVDAEDKVIFGLKTDGKTYVGDADFLNNIKNNQEAINEIKSTLASIGSIIESLDIDTLSSITAVENPEYIDIKTDSEDKVLEGIKTDGTKVINTDLELNAKLKQQGVITEVVDNPEYLEAKVDAEGKLIEGINKNGEKIFGVIPPQIKQYIDNNMPSGSGVSNIEYDDATGDMYATYDDESGVTDVYMEPNGDIYVESEE